MAAQQKLTATEPSRTRPGRLPYARMVQNFLLLWLDGNIDETNNDDCRNSITKLRQVVNTVNTFTDANECINFINGIKEETIFMISSGAFGQTTVPVVHDKSQISTIYIFCGNKNRHENLAQQWPKVKGVFTDITPICKALKQAAQDCDQNMVSISFVKSDDGATKKNLDQLDQSFMYTQILKEILLTIDFDQEHIDEFLIYCREQLAGNITELINVTKLENEYGQHQPIWWYTYDCFLYSMLNRALRVMDVDLIIKMGFFVRDLHNHITTLHVEQYGAQNHSKSLTVYRGQGLSLTDFEQLMKTEGGLLSFNNFLSTSENRNVSLEFARRTVITSNLVGVLFIMNIDPSMSATPFANVRNVSAYQTEEEILFSMHSIFRIGLAKQIDGNNRLWQVDLTLTSDKDPQLHVLTKRMQKETSGSTGWLRLGKLMLKLGHFNKAEELYELLLKQTTDEREKAFIYCQLGWTKDDQGKYLEAIAYYQKSIEIENLLLPPNHINFANSYNNIGVTYQKMGEYSKALSYYEKALEIKHKNLPSNDPDLAGSYNNIGLLYKKMGKNSEALSYYEKALEIKQKTLPSNHPSLAISYNNIGAIYANMKEYSRTLSYFNKVLEIQQNILPKNHPDLAVSYNNIGSVYEKLDEHSKALSFFERAVGVLQRSVPANHPDLLSFQTSVERVKKKL